MVGGLVRCEELQGSCTNVIRSLAALKRRWTGLEAEGEQQSFMLKLQYDRDDIFHSIEAFAAVSGVRIGHPSSRKKVVTTLTQLMLAPSEREHELPVQCSSNVSMVILTKMLNGIVVA